MNHSYKASYGRVILLPLEWKDIEPLRHARNAAREFFNDQRIISQEDQQNWFRKYSKTENDCMFRIAFANNEELFIGALALYNIDRIERAAEFGRFIINQSKTHGEKGLGLEACLASLDIAFEQMHLKRVYLEVLSENKRAQSVYLNAGFSPSGQLGTSTCMEICHK